MSEPTIRAHVFDGFDAFARARGADFPALLKDAGLSPSDLTDPDAELPLNAVAQIFDAAAQASDDPCLGLHWAEAYPEGGGRVIGYLLLNAKSARQAVKAIARYVELHLEPIDIRFEEKDGFGELIWRFPPGFTAPRLQYASFAMAIMVVRLRKYAGANWNPAGVELEHRAYADMKEVKRILGPNVTFDHTQNTLRMREAVLNRTSDEADNRLFALIREMGDKLLAERKVKDDIVALTERAILSQIGDGAVALEDIAGALELPPRTLQSQLAAAGTNFETILLETRQSLAEIYLRDSDLPLTEIAFLLGFSELSAFTRAARGWFGVPPSQRRSMLRGGGTGAGAAASSAGV